MTKIKIDMATMNMLRANDVGKTEQPTEKQIRETFFQKCAELIYSYYKL